VHFEIASALDLAFIKALTQNAAAGRRLFFRAIFD
jgi:hypothetical protein